MVDDENLVDKENMVDVNVNDMIDGDCFINLSSALKDKRSSKAKTNERWKRIRKEKEVLLPLQACWP